MEDFTEEGFHCEKVGFCLLLEVFSGFKAVLLLLEVTVGVLDFEGEDSPESLQEALFYDELIVFGVNFGGKHLKDGLQSFLVVSVEGSSEGVLLNLEGVMRRMMTYLHLVCQVLLDLLESINEFRGRQLLLRVFEYEEEFLGVKRGNLDRVVGSFSAEFFILVSERHSFFLRLVL